MQLCCYGNIETDEYFVCVGIVSVFNLFKYYRLLIFSNSNDAFRSGAERQFLIKNDAVGYYNYLYFPFV